MGALPNYLDTPLLACEGCYPLLGLLLLTETSLSRAYPRLRPGSSFTPPPFRWARDQQVKSFWALDRELRAEGSRSSSVLVAGLQRGRPFVGEVPGKPGAWSWS